jgi:hypothetical protein
MPNFGVYIYLFHVLGIFPRNDMEISSFMLGDSIVSPIIQYVVEWHGLFSNLILSLKVHMIG